MVARGFEAARARERRVELRAHRITGELLKEAVEPVRERVRQEAARIGEQGEKALRYLAESAFHQEGFTIEHWFKEAGLRGKSQRTRFRRAVGVTPKQYLDICRFEVALRIFEMLPDLPIEVVSASIGYSVETAFYKRFTGIFSMPPGRARDLLTNDELSVEEIIAVGIEQTQGERRTFEGRTSPKAGCTKSLGGKGGDADRQFFEEVLWARLCAASPEERRELVNCGFRFQSTAIVSELMRRSIEDCRSDRRLGERIGRLAVQAVWAIKDQLSESEFLDLRVGSLANLGNCQRLAGDMAGAETSFKEAALEATKGSITEEILGDFNFLRGHFCTYKRSFEEAAELLGRAYDIRSRSDTEGPRAQVAIAQGYAYELQGRWEDALSCYSSAENLLAEQKPNGGYLLAVVYSRFANVYISSKKLSEAEANLEAAEKILRRHGQESGLSRLIWLKGLLAFEKGETREAEEYLREARGQLSCTGEIVNEALVNIDLALMCLGRNENKEALDLVVEALAVLKTWNIPDEILGAWKILVRAAKGAALDLAALLQIREVLEVRSGAPHFAYAASKDDARKKG